MLIDAWIQCLQCRGTSGWRRTSRASRARRRAWPTPQLEALEQRVLLSAVTTTIVSVSDPTAAYGQTETLTATVTSAAGTPNAGTVTFQSGAATLGTALVSNGSAILKTTALP